MNSRELKQKIINESHGLIDDEKIKDWEEFVYNMMNGKFYLNILQTSFICLKELKNNKSFEEIEKFYQEQLNEGRDAVATIISYFSIRGEEFKQYFKIKKLQSFCDKTINNKTLELLEEEFELYYNKLLKILGIKRASSANTKRK